MGDDLALELSKKAGLAGSERDLMKFLQEIEAAGASDVILVPTSKNIEQLRMAEEIITSLKFCNKN
jgi:hypothetical protein